MRVLVACECSGIVREAFRRRGHDAWSCDLKEAEDGSEHHLREDALGVLRRGWDLLIAHPPCTHLASSGNGSRGRKDKREVEEAVDFARAFILTREVELVCVENPVGILTSRVRPPDQVVHPWWFGDPVAKRTCLWLRGLRPLRKTQVVEPWDWSIWNKGRGKERGVIRSRTFPGLAEAMAEQWG